MKMFLIHPVSLAPRTCLPRTTKCESRRPIATGCFVYSYLEAVPSYYYIYVGEDAAEQLLRQLLTNAEEVENTVKAKGPLTLTREDFTN